MYAPVVHSHKQLWPSVMHSKINNITSSENALTILQGLHVILGDVMTALTYDLRMGIKTSYA